MATQYTIYFAGELFDHKHLIGNALLAENIERLSDGRYRCVLPQDLEQTDARAVDIRNQDLIGVATCDLALFNFDGSDLDSGTVVEFVYAKLLDIPAVILRTDFRGGGDQTDGDAWNLMASFYPRTRNVTLNAMAWYQEARRESDTASDAAARYCDRIARAVIDALDAVRAEPPLLAAAAPDDIEHLYRWAMRFPGNGLAERMAGDSSLRDAVQALVVDKTRKGLMGRDR